MSRYVMPHHIIVRPLERRVPWSPEGSTLPVNEQPWDASLQPDIPVATLPRVALAVSIVSIMRCTTYTLTFASFAIASASVAVLSLAVATDSWLHTRERLPLATLGEEEALQMNDTWVRVWAGMWRVCMEVEGFPGVPPDCMEINYEVGDSRGENMTITSITIVASARRSVALPVSALIVNVVGTIFTFIGNVRKDVRTLVGAICFVLAG
ncbi:hypothetical protein ACOMHN_064117 [Nucella lapillus]